ncbi:hypothetical protein [Burkholderia phage BCSR5]|nr:hypothetical protein [Burkholderia phage BCSR5]
MAKAQYYRGGRFAPNTHLAELHTAWEKTHPSAKVEIEVHDPKTNKTTKVFVNAKTHARAKLDDHFEALEAQFKQDYPTWKAYP